MPGVDIVPDPPPTTMMHLLLDATAESFETAAVKLAGDECIWTWPSAQTTLSPDVQRVELVVGDATMEFSPDEAAAVIARLVRA